MAALPSICGQAQDEGAKGEDVSRAQACADAGTWCGGHWAAWSSLVQARQAGEAAAARGQQLHDLAAMTTCAGAAPRATSRHTCTPPDEGCCAPGAANSLMRDCCRAEEGAHVAATRTSIEPLTAFMASKKVAISVVPL